MPDLDPDVTLLNGLLEAPESARSDARTPRVDRWTHARGRANSPYRLWPFETQLGATIPAVEEGLPRVKHDVTTFGLDAEGRSVLERVYGDDARLEAETVGTHSDTQRIYVTSAVQAGRCAVERACVERWASGRILCATTMSRYEPGRWLRVEFRWEADRIVAFVERRPTEGREETYLVEYADDGQPSALTRGSETVWRRRSGRKGRPGLAELEERYADALAAAIAENLRVDPPPGALARVVIRWFEGPDYLTIHALGSDEEHAVDTDDAWYPLEWPNEPREIERVGAIFEDEALRSRAAELLAELEDGSWSWEQQPRPLVAAARKLRERLESSHALVDHFAAGVCHFEGWGAAESVPLANPRSAVEKLREMGLGPAD